MLLNYFDYFKHFEVIEDELQVVNLTVELLQLLRGGVTHVTAYFIIVTSYERYVGICTPYNFATAFSSKKRWRYFQVVLVIVCLILTLNSWNIVFFIVGDGKADSVESTITVSHYEKKNENLILLHQD